VLTLQETPTLEGLQKISRGIKSIGQSNEMLIVVDGMPINNSNTSINGLTSQSTGGQGYDYGSNGMDINQMTSSKKV
jgi:hypothetical protein